MVTYGMEKPCRVQDQYENRTGPVHGTGTAFRQGKSCLGPIKFSGRSLETCGQPHVQINDRHPGGDMTQLFSIGIVSQARAYRTRLIDPPPLSEPGQTSGLKPETGTTAGPMTVRGRRRESPRLDAGGSSRLAYYLAGATPNSLTLMPMFPTRPSISACSLSSPWASLRWRALAGHSPNVASTGIHLPR